MKCDCGERMKIDVHKSNAGYYIGYWCKNCGPYSRESEYFREKSTAEDELKEYKKWP